MGLKQALLRLDGVESFDMVLRSGEVSLEVRRGTMLVVAELRTVVDDGGLTLLAVTPPGRPDEADLGATEHATDPVCHMRVPKRDDALKWHHGGTDHYFCSDYCFNLFKAGPERYLK